MDQIEYKIFFPEKMPVDVRKQIRFDTSRLVESIMQESTTSEDLLRRRLTREFGDLKVSHYERIQEANDSTNATIKVYQDRVDELQRQVDTLKMKIR